MNSLNGIITYYDFDANKNEWFIEHFISTAKKNNIHITYISAEELIPYISSNDGFDSISVKLGFIPNFVINRSRDCLISEYFETNNIKVFNSSLVTKIANDKELTYNYLKSKGINFLPYIIIPRDFIENGSSEEILTSAASLNYPLVLKPTEGHGGAYIYLINNSSDLYSVIGQLKEEYKNNSINYSKFLLQRKSSTQGKDLRVYVLNNDILKGILRSSDTDFRSNFSLGGNANVHELSTEEKELVQKVINIFPSDFIGIDFIYDNNLPILNEIEDAVGCRMLYSQTNIDVIELYVQHILNFFKK